MRSEYCRVDRWSYRYMNWEVCGHQFDTLEEAVADYDCRKKRSPKLRTRIVKITTEVVHTDAID